jgi:3-oxoacyl-[acyl-carrier protein] reductase
VAKHNVAINYLLPGPFLTDRQKDGLVKLAAKAGQDYDSFLKARVAENPAGRFGTPEEFGKACAFLCSADVGFIVGQNLVIDGGSVNVTM